MRLSFLRIANYRSISDLSMDNLGELVTLIGQNSSGKSNILEALQLFFNSFEVIGGNTPGIDDYWFHNRTATSPASFEMGFELTSKEALTIFPADWVQFSEVTAHPPDEATGRALHKVTIKRQLSYPQGNWVTNEIRWGETTLVTANAPVPFERIREAVSARLAKEGGTPIHDPSGQGVGVPNVTAATVTQSLANLTKFVKGKFVLIPASRDVKGAGPQRVTVLDPSIQQKLWQLNQSTKPDDEEVNGKIEATFQEVTGEQLDLAQALAFVRRRGRIPLTLEGGGIQSTANLIYTLLAESAGGAIFALEEPETHAHPGLQRRLYRALKELAGETQIFVASHSPTFVDRSAGRITWMVKLDAHGTSATPLQNPAEVIQELGVRLSDVFLANKVLLVEGRSDEIAIASFAAHAGIELEDIQILSMEGKASAPRRLHDLVIATKGLVPAFLLLDKDANDEATAIRKEGLLGPENVHVLSRGTIEDYYPSDVVESAVKGLDARFKLGLLDSEAWTKYKAGDLKLRDIDLGKKLLDLPGSWPVVLAGAVAQSLKEFEGPVPEELRQFLLRVVRQ
jgi:energy-coupling factor transporter ATP-binding protein EcfA2